MQILLVDDEQWSVESVRQFLRGTTLFKVDYKSHFSELGENASSICEAIAPYDLLVLDVFMKGRDPEPFVEFIRTIAGKKPFIAYTLLHKQEDVEHAAGEPEPQELAKMVYENGGIGLVTKGFSGNRTPSQEAIRDREYDLYERVLSFYWSVRTALQKCGHTF